MSSTGDVRPQNPTQLRYEHRMMLEHLKSSKWAGNFSIPTSGVVTITAHVSTTALKHLTLISCKQLRVGQQWTGGYLLLRTLEQVVRGTGIVTIVEDHLGEVTMLDLHNFIDDKLGITPEQALPAGTVLTLKEPYFKRSASGNFLLRCESPTDVAIIGRDSPMYDLVQKTRWQHVPADFPLLAKFTGKTADEWKRRGNELFGQKCYNEAREAYGVALGLTEGKLREQELRTVIQLNLAACFLSMGYFEDAVKYAGYVLAVDQRNKKALLRTARACYQLRQYQMALDYFEQLAPEDQIEVQNEVAKCKDRLTEEQSGVSLNRLYLAFKSNQDTVLDVADYKGPWRIGPIVPGRGRSVIATQDITPGTLLLVCQAFQISSTKSGSGDHGGNTALVTNMIHAIMRNPIVFGSAVYDLTSSDAELDRRKRYCDEQAEIEPIADVQRLRAIVQMNAFSLWSGTKQRDGGAVFLAASYFNHSCVPNASWKVYGNVLVVHAIRSIPSSAEITISYHECSGYTFAERQQFFAIRKFSCTCPLCQLDKMGSARERSIREQLVLEERHLMNLLQLPSTEMRLLNDILAHNAEIIKKMQRSYAYEKRTKVQVDLFFPYRTQFALSMRMGNFHLAMAGLKNAFASLGVKLERLLVCAETGDVQIFDQDVVFTSSLEELLIAVRGLTSVLPGLHGAETTRRYTAALELMKKVTAGSTRLMLKVEGLKH